MLCYHVRNRFLLLPGELNETKYTRFVIEKQSTDFNHLECGVGRKNFRMYRDKGNNFARYSQIAPEPGDAFQSA